MTNKQWLKKLEHQQRTGKIRAFQVEQRKPQAVPVPAGNRNTESKGKDYIGWNLPYWCNEQAVTLETEYEFCPPRKYRFDWAIPALKVAIEFEGGLFDRNGSHTSFNAVNRDIEKYNLAQREGWKVLRYSAKNYENLLNDLRHVLSARM